MMQKFFSSLIFSICLFMLFQSVLPSISQNSEKWFPEKRILSDEKTLFPTQKLYPLQLGCKTHVTTPQSLYARAYCVMDMDSERVLYGKNQNKTLPMASTTKIMTCILALENGQPGQKVAVSSYAASMPDVQLNICTGEKYYLRDLLYSLMLESHNDTAVAIAEALGKSVEGFAEMMNQKAEDLGCTHTHFVTPNGLDHPEHYTTASDLCRIAAYAMKNKKFQKIIQTEQYQFSDCDAKRSFSVHNHDAFLALYEGALGIKTGFTGNAGYCFCGAAKKNHRTQLSAVLACGWPPNKGYKWSDTKKLMDYGFEGFENVEIPVSKRTYPIQVLHGVKSQIFAQRINTKAMIYPLTASDHLEIKTQLSSYTKAPVRCGDVLGTEDYFVNGKVIRQIPLISTEDIDEISFLFWLRHLGRLFFLR